MKQINGIKESQQIGLQILKWLDGYCKKKQIRYWLAYGTLLGAARHEGFIPWDDDVDVFMPRKDYLRFIKLMKISRGGRYQLYSIETKGRNNRCSFGKLCDTYTIAKEKGVDEKFATGIWVDIFPLDGLGNCENKARLQLNKIFEFSKRILFLETAKNYGIKGRLLQLFGRKNLNHCMKRVCKRYGFDESLYVANGMTSSKNLFQKAWFDKTDEMKFEGTSFCVPWKWKEVLMEVYGDYLKLPPEEERKPLHLAEAYWIKEPDI